VIAGVRSSQRIEAENVGADRVIALDDAKEIAALSELDAIADMGVMTQLIGFCRTSGRTECWRVCSAPHPLRQGAICVLRPSGLSLML
jgi:hypothetical protein